MDITHLRSTARPEMTPAMKLSEGQIAALRILYREWLLTPSVPAFVGQGCVRVSAQTAPGGSAFWQEASIASPTARSLVARGLAEFCFGPKLVRITAAGIRGLASALARKEQP